MKLINITAPQYRCSIGACPAVYRSGENFIIVGPEVHPVPERLEGKIGITEGAVEIPADLLLASLGVTELAEAVQEFLDISHKCGSPEDLTVDHIISEKNGGPSEQSNYQTLCRSCNSKKGAR